MGAGIYIIQAAINNNFSWSGFTKSIITGTITGAVSGGLGQVFSASGFWATVGNGVLVGAGTGGVTSLINGTNFLEGLAKGAVIGGTIGAISWGVNEMVDAARVTREAKMNHEYKAVESDVYNNPNNYSNEHVDYSIETVKDFEKGYGGLGSYGVGYTYNRTPEGYGLANNNLFYKKTWFENMFGDTVSLSV